MNISINEKPTVSAIIITKNEENNIHQCLKYIVTQDYPHDKIEIIISDGGSTDQTIPLIKSFNFKGINYSIISKENSNRAQGLNLGIDKAQGDFIIRIDSRTQIDKDYFTKCIETILETGADNVGGIQVPLFKNNFQKAVALVMSSPLGSGNPKYRSSKKSGPVDTLYLGCFNKNIFKKIGTFDETSQYISEDSDFNQRIIQSGGTVYLNTKIKVYYYPRNNLKDFTKLCFQYGRSRAGNFIKIKKFTSIRQMIPLLFLFTFIFCSISIFLKNDFYLPSALFLLFYFLICFSVSVFISYKSQIKLKNILVLIPISFVSFIVIHITWPLGFSTYLLKKGFQKLSFQK